MKISYRIIILPGNLEIKQEKMDALWIFGYAFLLLISHFFYTRLINYIDDKPLGYQSLYDLILRDHFCVMRLCGKIYCLVAIISRWKTLMDLCKTNIFFVTCLCSVYDFAFTSACMTTGINEINTFTWLFKTIL
jgi:hypothetical protein